MFYVLAALSSFAVPNADALESLEQTIECTGKKLEEQKKIKNLLLEFTDLKKRFIKETTTKNEAWRMVKLSSEMIKLIEREHLETLFTLEFLEELKVFSIFANKTSIVVKDKKL
jgi:hypothetical protein